MDRPTEIPNDTEPATGFFRRRHRDLERLAVWALIIAGAGLRFRYLWDFAGSPLYALAIGADVREYYLRAHEIANGVFFPVSPDIHAPVYSCFLALLTKLGCGVPAVRAAQLFLNFGAWIAFYLLLKRENRPPKIRLTFLGVAMLFPAAIFYQAELVSESLLVPLAAGFFWARRLADEARTAARRRGRLAGAGLALAAMNLTHPMTLLFDVAEVGRELALRKYRRAALLAAVPIAVVGGFCAAQSLHYRQLCGIQANTGFNLYLGNNPDANGGCYLRPGKRWRKIHREAEQEAEKRGISPDAVFRERAARFWLRHPGKALRLWGNKALKVFSPSELASGSDLPPIFYFSGTMFAGVVLTPALFLLAAFGLWRIFRTRAGAECIHYLLLFFSMYLAQIVTVTSGRYRMLMLVPAALFAGVGMRDFRWRRYWWVFPPVIIVCAAFNVTNYGQMRPETALLYAEAALKNDDPRQAAALAAFALRSREDPDTAHGWELRGAAAERLSRIALEASREAETRKDREAAAGSRDEVRRQIDLAEKYYSKMVEAEPTFYRGPMHLAVLAEERGDDDPTGKWYDLAETRYREALKLEPRAADLCYNYARFRFRTGRPCADAVRSALRAAPASPRAWNLAGLSALAHDKDLRYAAECFWRAAELEPDPETRDKYLNSLRFVEYQLKNRK